MVGTEPLSVRHYTQEELHSLITSHYDMMVKTARGIMRRTNSRLGLSGEDLVHQVVLNLLTNNSFKDPNPDRFLTYMSRAIDNRHLNYLKADKIRRSTHHLGTTYRNLAFDRMRVTRDSLGDYFEELPELEREKTLSLDQKNGDGITIAYLRLLMKTVKPRELYPFYDYEVRGLSYEEIAKRNNVPSGTIKSRISRARRQLKKLVNGHATIDDLLLEK